jgi:cation diffusion facilitator family transporter
VHEGSKKAIIAAFLANLGIAIAKFIGFLITRSAGLLAESAHSLADTGNQGLLLFGSKRALRKADRQHPFGYGPERYFWSFVVALVLFSMGGLFAIYEGISKLAHPHGIDSAIVAYIILGLSIVLEGYSLRTAVHEAAPLKGAGQSWWSFIKEAKSPELPVVLLEDAGALIGLVFALLGLSLAEITGNARFDAVGSIAIGVLLVAIAIVLAVEMKGLLIGESAADDVQQVLLEAGCTLAIAPVAAAPGTPEWIAQRASSSPARVTGRTLFRACPSPGRTNRRRRSATASRLKFARSPTP